MDNSETTLGQKIKRYRLINDIRQEDMAERLNVSRATLINYEKGHTVINVDVLERLTGAYPDFDKNLVKPKIIENNYINFSVLFSIFKSNRKYLLITGVLFMILGYSLSFLFPEKYSADISLYPAKKDLMQGMGQFQALAMNLGINKANNDQDFNIPDVVRSRLIATKVINQSWNTIKGEKIDLIELWNLGNRKWYNFLFNFSTDSLEIYEAGIKKLQKHINVTEDRLTGLININTNFEDPIISSNIANFIGQQVQNYIQKENSAQSTKEKIFISERLTVVRKELENSESELKNFLERNRGYEDSPELFMVFSRLSREFEAKKEVYLTLQQQLELARIEEVRMSPILHILDYAVQPTSKSSPIRLLYAVSFLIIGLFSAFFVSVFRY